MTEPSVQVHIVYKLVNDDDFETDIRVYTYSERSIAITTTEHFGKAFKTQLADINGKYNKNLKIGAGWVFSNLKYPALQELIGKITSFEIKGEIPVEYGKKSSFNPLNGATGPLGPIPTEPKLISLMKQSLQELTACSQHSKNIFTDGNGNKYVWGTIETVDTLVKDMGLRPHTHLQTLSHKIVVSK